MKVLFVSNLFPNCQEPARGIFNFHQLRHLTQYCEVQAIAPLAHLPFQSGKAIPSMEEIGGIPVHHPRQYYLPKIGRSLNPCLFALSIRRTAINLRATFPFDVIFANWAYPDACGTARIARRLSIPYVASISGSDANVYLNYKIRRRQILHMLDRARAITVRSQALKTLLTSHGVPADKVHVLYNGVDRTLFRPQTADHGLQILTTRQNLQSPVSNLQSTQLLYVGRLSPEKGVDDLLHALAATPEATQLLVIGDGPQRFSLQQLARNLHIESRIQWLGWKHPDEIATYLSAADVACLPSHMEGVPNVALEAFACGTPVVACAVGGVPEVVTATTGILVPARDPVAFAAALRQALAKSWNQSAITAHATRFDWNENARQLHRLLQSAVQSS